MDSDPEFVATFDDKTTTPRLCQYCYFRNDSLKLARGTVCHNLAGHVLHADLCLWCADVLQSFIDLAALTDEKDSREKDTEEKDTEEKDTGQKDPAPVTTTPAVGQTFGKIWVRCNTCMLEVAPRSFYTWEEFVSPQHTGSHDKYWWELDLSYPYRPPEGAVPCPECLFVVPGIAWLSDHMRVHKQGKPE